jgi:hypothetical protein
MVNLPPMAKKIWQCLDPTLIASSTIIVLSTPPYSLTSPNAQLSMTRHNSSNNYIEMERAGMEMFSLLKQYPMLCGPKLLGLS